VELLERDDRTVVIALEVRAGDYKAWCERRGVSPRFGAVGEHGSIAVIERFFRSLKTEMLRKLPWVPMSRKKLAEEVAAYMGW
jgi:transposase InsO family protein